MFLGAPLFAENTLVKPIVYAKIACNQVLYFGRFVVQELGKNRGMSWDISWPY